MCSCVIKNSCCVLYWFQLQTLDNLTANWCFNLQHCIFVDGSRRLTVYCFSTDAVHIYIFVLQYFVFFELLIISLQFFTCSFYRTLRSTSIEVTASIIRFAFFYCDSSHSSFYWKRITCVFTANFFNRVNYIMCCTCEIQPLLSCFVTVNENIEWFSQCVGLNYGNLIKQVIMLPVGVKKSKRSPLFTETLLGIPFLMLTALTSHTIYWHPFHGTLRFIG